MIEDSVMEVRVKAIVRVRVMVASSLADVRLGDRLRLGLGTISST